MTLDKIKKGQLVKIKHIGCKDIKDKAIRMGICEGEVVVCRQIIPAGPVVICKRSQEIAWGRGLAQKIGVEPVPVPLKDCEGCLINSTKTNECI